MAKNEEEEHELHVPHSCCKPTHSILDTCFKYSLQQNTHLARSSWLLERIATLLLQSFIARHVSENETITSEEQPPLRFIVGADAIGRLLYDALFALYFDGVI